MNDEPLVRSGHIAGSVDEEYSEVNVSCKKDADQYIRSLISIVFYGK